MKKYVNAALVVAYGLSLFSCARAQFQEDLSVWEGNTLLQNQGDQPTTAQFDWSKKTGLWLMPDLIPVPLEVKDLEQAGDSVWFSVNFRSGPAMASARIAEGKLKGILRKEGLEPAPFSLSEMDFGPLEEVIKPEADAPYEWSTHGELPEEKAVIERLQKLVAQYDLEPYVFTKKVKVQRAAIPHSHPVLTLNVADTTDLMLLGTFLHEQMHWYSLYLGDQLNPVGEVMAIRYPKVPSEFPEGAGTEQSTFLHLGVCFLEFKALESVLGRDQALEYLQAMTQRHYRWVYRTILEDMDQFEALFAKHQLPNWE
ncbi:MAG: hypothetical protein AAFQ98_11255 [Bacteroidota bacterium]